LGLFENAAAQAVPGLAKALSADSVEVRVAAAQALGAIGPDARTAVPQLGKALDDPAGIVTLSAAEALGSIKGPAVKVLADRLKQPEFLPLAAAVLGHMGPDAVDALPELVKQLNAQETESQIEVLIAIAAIGPKAKAATEPLLNLLKNGKGQPQRGAVYALAKIGAKESIPQLQKGVMQTDDPLLQRTCAWALVTLDPTNGEYVDQALPRLIVGLTDEIPLVRKECAIAIQLIGPKAKVAVPDLVIALESPDPELQTEILDALAQIGPDARPAIPAAVKLLNSPHPLVQYTAMHLLGRMGKAAQDAAPALEKKLMGRDEFGQAVAAWALVNIDGNAENIRRAIPLMIKALGYESPQVRAKAAEMLGKIGTDSPDAKAALQKAAKEDEDETVRQSAEKALSALN
jgi:HEAT repeat protein